MDYEIRAMSIVEILDTALRLLTNHFMLFVGLFAAVNVPAGLITQYLESSPQAVTAAQVVDSLSSSLAVILVGIVVFSFLYPLAWLAVTHAIVEQYCGREIGFVDALRYSMANFWRFASTWMLTTLFISLGLLALIIPGIYLFFAFYLVGSVMVVERVYGMPALQRSRALMSGNFGRAFVLLVAIILIMIVLGGAAELVLGQVPLINWFVGPLVESLVGAYATAALVVLYFDIRCRKEGFAIEHLTGPIEPHGNVTTSIGA